MDASFSRGRAGQMIWKNLPEFSGPLVRILFFLLLFKLARPFFPRIVALAGLRLFTNNVERTADAWTARDRLTVAFQAADLAGGRVDDHHRVECLIVMRWKLPANEETSRHTDQGASGDQDSSLHRSSSRERLLVVGQSALDLNFFFAE